MHSMVLFVLRVSEDDDDESSSNFSFLKRKHIDLFRGPDKKRMDCSQKRLSAGIARDPPQHFGAWC